MFKEMRRKKQQLTVGECEEILNTASFGVLALSGEDGYPYAVPMSYVYSGEDGCVYFHCAKKGHKLDAIAHDSRASFCVVGQNSIVPEEYTTYFKSVIAFGEINEVTDDNQKKHAIAMLAKRYAPDDSEENREAAITREWPALCILKLCIKHLTGKAAKELIAYR